MCLFYAFLPQNGRKQHYGGILGKSRRCRDADSRVGSRPHRDHRSVASGHVDGHRHRLRDRPAARRRGGRLLLSRPSRGGGDPELPHGPAAGGGGPLRLPDAVGLRSPRRAGPALYSDRDDHRAGDPHHAHRGGADPTGRSKTCTGSTRNSSRRSRSAPSIGSPRSCGMPATACSRSRWRALAARWPRSARCSSWAATSIT